MIKRRASQPLAQLGPSDVVVLLRQPFRNGKTQALVWGVLVLGGLGSYMHNLNAHHSAQLAAISMIAFILTGRVALYGAAAVFLRQMSESFLKLRHMALRGEARIRYIQLARGALREQLLDGTTNEVVRVSDLPRRTGAARLRLLRATQTPFELLFR